MFDNLKFGKAFKTGAVKDWGRKELLNLSQLNRLTLAESSIVDSEQLEVLFKFGDSGVRTAVLKNPKTSIFFLIKLFEGTAIYGDERELISKLMENERATEFRLYYEEKRNLRKQSPI